MKLTFRNNQQIAKASRAYARVRLLEGEKGMQRIARESGIDYLEIGVGRMREMTQRRFILLCRAVVVAAKQQKKRKIALQFDQTPEIFKGLQDLSPERIASLAAQAFEMANFEFTDYKTPPKEGFPIVEEIQLFGASSRSIEAAGREGQRIGQAVNACRTLANTPGGDMTPKRLAEAARKAARGTKASVKVLGRREMEKLKMGAILGVAKGSDAEPQFLIIEYRGGKRGEKPIVLVGKGVTFDTGGLNLKPESGIYEMHMDMSGGAAVIHACVLAAKLKIKRNVIAIVPAVENMPSGASYRPGDQLRSLSGKTIEVLNTDAEGRIILADALTYAKRYKPMLVVDVATLTGAAMVALGQQASALLTRDTGLQAELVRLGEESGDYLWPLPLWDEYEDMVKGHFGDVANISTQGNSRYGGVISGGMFLWQFAKELECPWAHIDMAPRMTAAPGEYLAKGAAGAPVRLLLRILESYAGRD